MQPVRYIEPADWMTDYRTVKIMQVLGGYKDPFDALFVGGCVRNLLIGRAVKDIDIATTLAPMDVIDRLSAAGIRHVPTGLDHGTITGIVEDMPFEITTLRRDISTDGRHAVIAFTKDWREDAQRRDFTMNTLLAAPDGEIFDPLGQGVSDLVARRVVFVGEPAERIAEDYLRILRFFRFHAEYGEGRPDEAAMKACKAHADKIALLSKERVTQEFLKILAVPHVADVLELMWSCNILVLDKKPTVRKVSMERLADLQARYEAKDVIARIFLLAGMKINFFDTAFVLSNAQKKKIEHLAAGLKVLRRITKKKMRELVYLFGNDAALQTYFIALAKNDDFPDLEMLDIARYWQAPVFPVTGDDLINAGVLRGPSIGKKLKALEEKWIASDFTKVPKF